MAHCPHQSSCISVPVSERGFSLHVPSCLRPKQPVQAFGAAVPHAGQLPGRTGCPPVLLRFFLPGLTGNRSVLFMEAVRAGPVGLHVAAKSVLLCQGKNVVCVSKAGRCMTASDLVRAKILKLRIKHARTPVKQFKQTQPEPSLRQKDKNTQDLTRKSRLCSLKIWPVFCCLRHKNNPAFSMLQTIISEQDKFLTRICS